VTEHVIGFVGLGQMGGRMVRRLLAAGHQVCALDTSTDAMDRAEEAGAIRAASVADVARASDVVMLSLPSPAVVRDVVCGPDGLAATGGFDCLIDFSHPLIGVQSLSVELNNGAFGRDIAAARTFGFTNEIEALRKANLIRGGSLDNAIVLTPEGMLNETGLRFRDEFVRHKILDIIGDLALLGMPILGKVVAERSGHIMHAGLMSKLLRVRSAWDIVDM
jgi:UDP-3-O-[3-hydroxymyristoyl] N-acetylglucosamine deacetylase